MTLQFVETKEFSFPLIGLVIIMLRGTNPDNEGVVSLPPRDGCVGESLDPVLGMCLFCSFLVGLFCRGLTQ